MAEPLPPTRRPNRLARESSPYLLQHAHNPVDWFAWGPEAFEEARRRDVPIFLSVGYATCYWCHVMERESFENEAIGRLMSERFVCVKVDREERPDVDDVYMAAVQIMTGHGGWPMSCFLEPRGLRPFWCGTYFPPVPARGMPGFPQVLEGMSSAWRAQRADVLAQAEAVAESVRRDLAERRAPAPVGVQDVGEAAQSLLRTLDGVHGGFGGAPKFPQPVFLELLLDTRDHAGDDATRTAVDHAVCLTLDRMALGGVRDQLGGGFHRYSVDATWTVPHFEKMLYDNAQLLATYARAASTYRDGFYARVAREIVEDVLATMVAPGEQAGTGGFFSALDAEVDGREGLNYLWTPEQVRAALPGADAEDAVRVFGLDRGPNFRDPHHPDAPAASVLVLADRPERLAVTLGAASAAEATARLDRARVALLSARRQRRQPRTDNKVLAAWNGLMIAALARSARMLRETLDTSAWLATAERAADFLLRAHLESGEVLRASRGVAAGGTADAGRAHTPGFLEDYALVIQGLTELDAAGSARGPDYVGTAAALAERAAALFRDADGVWFDARAGQQDLFVRPRSTHDGALPSAGSSIVHALLGLAERTGEPRWREMALDGLASLSGAIAESPVGAANAARAIVRAVALWPDATEPLASAVTRDGAPRGGAVEPEQPVEVYADRDRVLVGEEMPAELNLSMRIAPGYHITSADPGPDGQGLSPLVIGVAGGTGLAVYADFPRGEALEAGGPLVHTGPVEIRVALERQGEWTGRPMLVVQYQACTQTECLLPTAVELAVAIDRA